MFLPPAAAAGRLLLLQDDICFVLWQLVVDRCGGHGRESGLGYMDICLSIFRMFANVSLRTSTFRRKTKHLDT